MNEPFRYRHLALELFNRIFLSSATSIVRTLIYLTDDLAIRSIQTDCSISISTKAALSEEGEDNTRKV